MKSERPTISVIIPVFNGACYLGEAIDSVLAQSKPPTEIIVIDDGSTDHTAAVARSFPSVHYLWQAQTGASQARNQGVAAATGDWLAFLDADDLWTTDKLANQGEVLTSDATVDLVFGQVEQFYSPELVETATLPALGDRHLLAGLHVGTMLIRRTAFEQIGPFAPQWQVAHFIEWYLRCQSIGLKSFVLPEVVMKRRIHTSNLGIRAYDRARQEYLRLAKAQLDRRSGRGNEDSANESN